MPEAYLQLVNPDGATTCVVWVVCRIMVRAWAMPSGRRRLWAAGAALVLALVAACYGCDIYEARRQAAEVVQAKTELARYLERVRDGDFHGAYRQLCSDVLPGYSEADHVEFLRSQPTPRAFELGKPERRLSIDGTFLVFGVRLTYLDGTSKVSSFAVGLQTDGPKVCDAFDWRGDVGGGGG